MPSAARTKTCAFIGVNLRAPGDALYLGAMQPDLRILAKRHPQLSTYGYLVRILYSGFLIGAGCLHELRLGARRIPHLHGREAAAAQHHLERGGVLAPSGSSGLSQPCKRCGAGRFAHPRCAPCDGSSRPRTLPSSGRSEHPPRGKFEGLAQGLYVVRMGDDVQRIQILQ